tara:strand:- start:2785 stop:3240 length:456 start_codon:yes stop_codon:yes gene_type:complete
MIKFIYKIIEKSLFIILLINLSVKLFANNFYDYPMFFLVDACQITQQRINPNNLSQDEILKGREKYSTCMNFIMSLSTTLNSRCINLDKTDLSPEENFTYADLSKVYTTQDIIQEVLLYSKKFPQFDNQIAWLHASKAISQKWPCIKNLNK